jgi:hypothetical protein
MSGFGPDLASYFGRRVNIATILLLFRGCLNISPHAYKFVNDRQLFIKGDDSLL